jgi:CcmD family protein
MLLLSVLLSFATLSSAAAQAGGLPQRAEPPRTLHGQTHVYIAYSIAWLLVFGYVLSLGRRFGRLEADLARIAEGPPR